VIILLRGVPQIEITEIQALEEERRTRSKKKLSRNVKIWSLKKMTSSSIQNIHLMGDIQG
jgi:hypothetical protein